MPGEAWIPIILFLVIGACITASLWFKHKLYQKQVDVISQAIEKGMDPEELKKAIEINKPNGGDINGNWKAGIILLILGGVTFLAMVPMIIQEYQRGHGLDEISGFLSMLIVPALGVAFIYIHKTIVGPVILHGQRHPRDMD